MINKEYTKQVTNLNENVAEIRQQALRELYEYVEGGRPQASTRREFRRKVERWLDKHSVTFYNVKTENVVAKHHIFYVYSKKTAHTLKCTWWLSDYGRTINYKYEPAKNSEIP